jgi:hypothetical protein
LGQDGLINAPNEEPLEEKSKNIQEIAAYPGQIPVNEKKSGTGFLA